MRAIKEDIVWPYEWDNPYVFENTFTDGVKSYNNDYPHMALDYKTPTQFTQNILLFSSG